MESLWMPRGIPCGGMWAGERGVQGAGDKPKPFFPFCPFLVSFPAVLGGHFHPWPCSLLGCPGGAMRWRCSDRGWERFGDGPSSSTPSAPCLIVWQPLCKEICGLFSGVCARL